MTETEQDLRIKKLQERVNNGYKWLTDNFGTHPKWFEYLSLYEKLYNELEFLKQKKG